MRFSMLFVPVFLPLAAGVVTLLFPRKVKWVQETLTLLCAAAVLAAGIAILVRQPPAVRLPLLEIGSFDLRLDLVPSALSVSILVVAAGLGFLVALYSLPYMASSSHRSRYYPFFLFALGGTSGVLLADHFLVFLIFWELVSASLYFLISSGTPESKAGATKTFVMLGGGDGCLLLGIGLVWLLARSFTLRGLGVSASGPAAATAFALLMIGAITKAGALPFHSWVPASSEGAPASAMALLPAALDKLLGIYLLVMLVTQVFVLTAGIGVVLMIIGALTILAAVMVAMVQHDLRRLLAYHAVSQVGYMLLGIGTLNPLGLVGGLLHMLNNAIYKNCLFLCAGAVEKRSGSTDLAELGGLARVMPVTFASCLISALAISGVPPLNGFVSKWYVYQGVIETGTRASFLFLVAAMFGSALTLASFVKVIYSVFLGTKSDTSAKVKRDVGLAMQLPMLVLALLSIGLGVFYRFPVQRLIAPGLDVQPASLGVWNSTLATGLIVLGLVVGLIIYLLGRYRSSARVVAPFIGGEQMDPQTSRIAGTRFYDTIREMPLLRGTYAAQEKGHLDPAGWIGAAGLAVTGLLRRIHSGLLSWYLSWSLLGVVVLLLLFSLLR